MRKLLTAALAASLIVGTAVAAFADDIYIDLSVDSDANDITLDLADGPTQTAVVTLTYRETGEGPTPEDGKAGCNLGGRNSQVTFPVNTSLVSGTAPTLDTSVTFDSCLDDNDEPVTATINISAAAVGVISVSLGSPTFTTGHAGVTASSWNVSGATFSVTVIDSTPVALLDATEIANAYLGARADNSDCKARWGTNKNKANWHGQLISHVAQHFQGQTFTNSTRSVVEGYVETACTA